MTDSAVPPSVWETARTQTGETLGDLSSRSPVLVIFLRHCGCTFAREALADVAAKRDAITNAGTGIVVVHMQSEEEARTLFARYGLEDLPRISDPQQELYRAFDIARGSLWQVAGPQMWWRAVEAISKGNLFGVPNTDVFQLPGAFLVHHRQVINAFRARNSSDRPDYIGLAQCDIGRVHPS